MSRVALIVAAMVLAPLPLIADSAGVIIITRAETPSHDRAQPFRFFHGTRWHPTDWHTDVQYWFENPVQLRSIDVVPCDGFAAMDPGLQLVAGENSWFDGDGYGTWLLRGKGKVVADDVLLDSLYLSMTDPEETCVERLVLKDAKGRIFEVRAPKLLDGTIKASETMSLAYHPARLVDGDPTTGWSTKGDGTGATLTVEFAAPTQLSGLRLMPGYFRSEKLWYANSSPSRVTVTAGQLEVGSFELPTTMPKGAVLLPFATPLTTASLTLRIDAIRKGKKYQDTLISELRFVDGDTVFALDPTKLVGEVEATNRAAFAEAKLDSWLDTWLRSVPRGWTLMVRADGLMEIGCGRRDDGHSYDARLTWELQKSAPGTVTLKFFGAAKKLTHPGLYDPPDPDKTVTETVNGRLTLQKTDKGFRVTKNRAAFLPVQEGAWEKGEF